MGNTRLGSTMRIPYKLHARKHTNKNGKQEIVTNASNEIGVETDVAKMNRLVNIMQNKIPKQ
jgi:hypothetical protein